MVTTGMKRYRTRTAAQAALVGIAADEAIDPGALFGRSAPLRLEIGFGHGRFLSQMAAAHPEADFLGVEHEDLRVTKTAHHSQRLGAENVRLFWDDAHRFVRQRLPLGILERCYILFPDPWPKRKHRRRRLLTRSLLNDLGRALAPGGRLIVASDRSDYAFQALTNSSTLPGLFTNRYAPAGYRFDIPTRYPTVFESHKKAEGCRIAYLMLERSEAPAPPPLPWSGVSGATKAPHARRPDGEERGDKVKK